MSKCKTAARRRKLARVKRLPDGCGYMGSHFGASYIDAECFGGRLYDMDYCDGDGLLFTPGDYVACPSCRTEEWLEDAAGHADEGIDGWSATSLFGWFYAIQIALRANRDATVTLLRSRFARVPFLIDRGDDFEQRTWEFSDEWLADFEAGERVALEKYESQFAR